MNSCPKCNYKRQQSDLYLHPDICPNCGIVYSKYLSKKSEPSSSEKENKSYSRNSRNNDVTQFAYWCLRAKESLTYIPEKITAESFWARVILLALFAIWGASFILGGMDWENIGSSFLHNINLPFHEFGHILFMPFGVFMTILGGSLFQIMVPLICTLVFIIKQKDNLAASICWWWVGQNFIDVSPYIADARDRALPLIGGGGEESHDWGNLLTMTNLLNQTKFIANCSFFIGSMIIISAILWGAWLLKKQKNTVVTMID